MSTDGLVSRLAVEPTHECPFWDVLAEFDVRSLNPGTRDSAPQVLVVGEAERVEDARALDSLIETDEGVICRLPSLGESRPPDRCGHERCLACGYDFLPVGPFDRQYANDRLYLDVAVDDSETVREVIGELEAAGFEVSVERLAGTVVGAASRLVIVDRGTLTPRQREVASLANELGYYESDGLSVTELAAELDVSEATVSEHLGEVERKVCKQLFPCH